MILKKTIHNNGYGCSCCGREWESSSWIDDFELPSIEEVIDRAIRCEPYAEFGDVISCIYEKDGKVLYGYNLDVRRSSYETFIYFKDQKHKLDVSGENGSTPEQIIEIVYAE